MVKDYGYDYGYLYAGNPNYVQTTAQHEYSGYPLPDLGILVTSNIRAALRTTQGYHIGYSTVWVTDGQNGKSTYRFFNSIPGFDSYFPASPTQAELGMGELFQEVHQDQNGAVLHSITNRYISDFTRTIRAKKVTFLSCVDGCGSCGLGENLCNQYAMVRNYEIKEGRRLLLEREEYKDGVTTRTNYSYSPNHNNPTRVSTKQSDGREQVADYEFIKDQYVSGCTINDSDCRQTYLNTVQSLRQQLAASIGACESFAASSCESQQEWTAGDCQFSSDWDEPLAGCQSACELRKRGECIEANGLLAIYQAGIKNAETEYLSCRALVVQTYDGCVQSSLASLNASDKVLATMIVGNWNGALEESTLMDESQIAGTKTHFDFQNNLLLPTDFEMYDTQLQDWSHEYSVLYDNKANIVQTKKRQDRSVAYLWGYKQTLPIAKIENCELMAEEEATPTSYTIPTVSVPGLQTDPLTIASNIDIPFDQDVTFDLSLSKEYADPSIPDSYFNVSIFLVNQTSQSQVYAGGFGLTTQTTHVISNVPAGKYLVQYQYLGDIGVDNTFTFNASLTYQANNRFANSYFTSFEEDVTNTTADAYTGRKSHVGTFTFNLPKQIGDYVLSYRTKDGSGAWIAHSETITVTTTESTMHTIGSAGQFLDEVRLYPTYSKMTTYTYDPSIGLTSMTDPNDLTSYFEYDELGRLVVVRDSDRNIIKHYKYHYQGQE
jgi:YD repeat-containing protein